MDHTVVSLLLTCFLTVQHSSCSDGPVFVNPALSVVPISSEANPGNLVTQTVYGFLDFTTTIGNTVMVFSPQSSAAPPIPVAELKKDAPTPVIDTKPVVAVKNASPAISPSKTQSPKEKQSDKKISTIVNVQSDPPPSHKTEIKSLPSSKINVIEGVASVVNIIDAPVGSSQVESGKQPQQQSVITKVEVITSQAKPIPSSRVEIIASPTVQSPILSSVVEIHSNEEPAVIIGNNIGEPEYDFLSRQPSEVVEETYKVINLKPSSKFHLKPRASAEPKNKASKRADGAHPTGLVTKLGGTVIKDGITTVHETSVIGTYISGKYAQVLQSTSRIQNPPQKGKINPSPTLRILKTAAPQLGKSNKHKNLEPTPAASINEETALPVENLFHSQNSVKSTRKPSNPGQSSKSSFKNRPRKQQNSEENVSEQESTQNRKKPSRSRSIQSSRTAKHHTPTSQSPNKYGRSNSKTTVSVHSEETTPAPSGPSGKRFQSRRNKPTRATASTESSVAGYSRRSGFKPKVQPSAVEQPSASTSLYKFKLNRSPGRWQYKTTPKPRVTIRRQNDEENETTQGTTPVSAQEAASPLSNDVVTPQARSDDVDGLVGSESVASIVDDESSTENKVDNNPFPVETVKIEISTPPDFKDTYYEIATIKTPYTFMVGSLKNTRYITVTSTFEKTFPNTETITPTTSEPLTENILVTTSNYAKDNNFLDSSVATLPPVYLASDVETPPLETLTETFSTTQTMLKTHILPVVRGNETESSTLVQTYLITRLVTATKTLPPMDAYHFIPSKTLNEFNSHLDEAGSELHLELEFGDNNEQDEDGQQRKLFPPDLDLAKVGSEFNLSDVDKSKIPEGHLRLKKAHVPTTSKPALPEPVPTPGLSPEQLQQLALLRLLNPAVAQQGQVITTSKPVVKVETVYESHVLPIINGANTLLTTLSKIVGTVTKTDYEFGTSTIAPALPLPPVNPLFAQPQQAQQQFAVTSSPVVQNTVITATDSKVLKLTFGAKTAYTTIFSTKVVPTVITTYMTASVPVQPTAAFPGYFPAPYPPFPYVG